MLPVFIKPVSQWQGWHGLKFFTLTNYEGNLNPIVLAPVQMSTLFNPFISIKNNRSLSSRGYSDLQHSGLADSPACSTFSWWSSQHPAADYNDLLGRFILKKHATRSPIRGACEAVKALCSLISSPIFDLCFFKNPMSPQDTRRRF